MYKFTQRVADLETFLLEELGTKFLLPSSNPDHAVYFMNGDRMEIDLVNKTMAFNSPEPTNPVSSRLNWKRHQWFVKSFIQEITPA